MKKFKNIIILASFLTFSYSTSSFAAEETVTIHTEAEENNSPDLNICSPTDFHISALDEIPEENAIKFLKYLSTFKNKLDTRSPFPEADQQVFNNAIELEKRTAWWMKYGQAMCYASVSFALISLLAFDENIDPATSLVIITCTTTVVSIFNAWLNFYATGTLPDAANRAADDRQYKFNQLCNNYIRLSRCLIDLHFSNHPSKKEFAADLAPKLHEAFAALRDVIKEKVGYIHADDILSPLKESIHYILHDKKLGISTDIQDYILIKEVRKRLELPD